MVKQMERRRAQTRASVLSVTHAVRGLNQQIQSYADTVGRQIGVHRSDLYAMDMIARWARRGEPVTPGQVARGMSMSAAAVTALVDRLQSAGHVLRRPDQQDRRRVRLELTTESAAMSRRKFTPMVWGMEDALAGYTDEELELVARVLDDVAASVQAVEPD